MRTTIDRAGRVVVPKELRERMRLHAGSELDITERDGVIELLPLPARVAIRTTPEGRVAVPIGELPPLTDDDIRGAVDATRG